MRDGLSNIDWEATTVETVGWLSRLIRAKTVNPPGNEIAAIKVVKEILDSKGFPQNDITILEDGEGRANLVARLRGDGSGRPLMLTGHVDVVPVEPQYWSQDPFGGEALDGCVWGRGALDMKADVAKYLQVFLLAFREKMPLKRDLIFSAIADEEAGFTHGSRFLVDQHRELIDAEYALNEGGAMTFHLGGARLYPIQVAEKGVCWLQATSRGKPGHGSMPHEDNAILHLSRGLERLRKAGHLPIHITPTVRRTLEAVSAQVKYPLGTMVGWMRFPWLAGWLLRFLPPDVKPALAAMFSNTVSPTILQAGMKVNVIPSIAQAEIDCRLLPGQKPDDAIRELQEIMGEGIDLDPVKTSTGTEFPVDTPLYRLLEKATRSMDPEGIVFPMLMPGATDAVVYQEAGMIVYGFTPGVLPEGFAVVKLAHGHDERVPISAIRTGLPALWQVINEFCCMGEA